MEKIPSKGVSEIPNVNSAMKMNNIQESGYSLHDRFSAGQKENTKIVFQLNKNQMALAPGQKELPENCCAG
jgi:hypothetical protein